MSYLRRILSAFLAVCMVISMCPAVTAAGTDAAEPDGKRIILNKDAFSGTASVWVDGVEYPVIQGTSACYVSLPEDVLPQAMTTYTYHVGNAEDVHTQYPTGMKVWALKEEGSDIFSPEELNDLENILQYSGSSIRITGTKGIRMITSIDLSKKQALVGSGLEGYTLLEYGTAISWASDLEGGKPLVLGQEHVKHNYAYKKGVADPVFKYEGNLMQYTNVLVGFNLDQCAPDIAMRSYMILEGEDGEQITVYGGIVTRSIGYVAWQNRYVFQQGSASYKYVWEIIRAVYGDISEVRFNTNGGSTVNAVIVQNGSPLKQPAAPTKEGFSFAGWYLDAALTKAYDFSKPVKDCMILYAKWTTEPTNVVVFNLRLDGIVPADKLSAYNAQHVVDGTIIQRPADPEPIVGEFQGWFTDTSCETEFDFSKPITEDTVIFANWYFDTTDSDGDTLPDDVEAYLGLNVGSEDSDGDGLPDRTELEIGTDPLLQDTDGNGVIDYDEDADGDTLSNGREYTIGTSPIYADTDFDGLADNEELDTYRTSPVEEDTDGDSASDSWELTHGYDPLVFNASFYTGVSSEGVSKANPVSASVELSLDGGQIETLSITRVTAATSPTVTASIPGYLGVAYNFEVSGSFDSALMKFEYDPALGTIGDDFQPRIYYVNEENGTLEELPNQSVTNGCVTATVTHFSTYILLNKVDFDKVWEAEIKAPIVSEDGTSSDIDVVFVIDRSGSMSSYSRLSTAKKALHTFISALGENDRAALIQFNTSAQTLSGLTKDKTHVDNLVNSISASGNTSMYTGLRSAVNMLCQSGETYGYKMIIVLSDGSDVPSTTYNKHYSSIVDQAVANNIIVYTIGAGSSVNTSILTQVATKTGGAYYTASVTDGILDAFDEIKEETVDVKTDSNFDGIPDYYNDLIVSGELVLSNGSTEFSGIDFNFDENGNPSNDYDGDGLLNGEEIRVITYDETVTLFKNSDPTLRHSDNDGIDDYEEVQNDTDPMRAPQYSMSDVNWLQGDQNYYYELYVDDVYDDSLIYQIDSAFLSLVFGVWNIEEIYRDVMIDYFATYAEPMDEINYDFETAALVENADNLIGFTSKYKRTIIDNLWYICNLEKNIRNLIDVVRGYGVTKEYLDLYFEYARQVAEFDPNANTFIMYTYKISGTAQATIEKYSPLKASKVNGVSVAFNVLSGAIDIADTLTSLAAVNTNYQIFDENMDILQEIKDNGSREYARKAAAIVIEELAGSYGSVLFDVIGGDIAELTANILITIASTNPYVKAVKFVRDSIAMVTGIKDSLKWEYQMLAYNCMAYSINRLIDRNSSSFGYSCYYGSDALPRYLTNLAHIRILGEKKFEEFYTHGMVSWGSDKELTRQSIALSISLIKSSAAFLDLKLSPYL